MKQKLFLINIQIFHIIFLLYKKLLKLLYQAPKTKSETIPYEFKSIQ